MYVFNDNGTLVIRALPKSHGNISGFHLLPTDALLAYGWYPLVDTQPPPVGPTQKLVSSLALNGNDAIRSWTVVDMTQEELAVTMEGIKQSLTGAVQDHLDEAAQEFGYDNIVSACSYSGAANPFQAEGLAFLNWRSSVWQYCYQVLSDVQASVRSIPSREELLAELPSLVLP